MDISMDKKYTLNGLPFTVLTVTKPGISPVLGYTSDGDSYSLSADGSRLFGNTALVEVSPYADFVIDEKVMVRDQNAEEWKRRHFAGCGQEGSPQTFFPCATSWTSTEKTITTWDQCRRPTAEELAE